MITLTLSESTLNGLLALVPDAQVTFESGYFRVYKKLKVGGAHIVCLPSIQDSSLILAVPFNSIRGDISKGFAAQVAKGIWGRVRDALMEDIAVNLVRVGLSTDTVEIEQFQDAHGETVGVIAVNLLNVNEWLRRQGWLAPLVASIQTILFSEHEIHIVLGVSAVSNVSPAPPRRLPAPPQYP